MSTDSLMDKYLGSRISACSLTGKYLGYGMDVLLIFAYITPVTQRRGDIFFGADENNS